MLPSAHQLWETLALQVLCVDGVLFCPVCIPELMTDLSQRFHVRGDRMEKRFLVGNGSGEVRYSGSGS